MQGLKRRLGYYLFASYRRKLLDRLLFENSSIYKGTVLDIGGRDRGIYKSPKDKVTRWITADIVKDRNPDIVLDVCDMKTIDNDSIDVINALELFEHVEDPIRGLSECTRVLKSGGVLVLSIPFLFPIHGDPNDYQRWTATKIERELTKLDFRISMLTSMGLYFTVLGDTLKAPIKSSRILMVICIVICPLLDLLTLLDELSIIKNHKILNKYTTGYFLIARKN